MGLRGSTERGESAQRVMLVPSRENRRCVRPALPYRVLRIRSAALRPLLAARRAGTEDSLIRQELQGACTENVLSEVGTYYSPLLSSTANCPGRCRCDFRFGISDFCRARLDSHSATRGPSRGSFLFNIPSRMICSELPLGVGAPIQCPVCRECPGAPIHMRKEGMFFRRHHKDSAPCFLVGASALPTWSQSRS
jgi:hypothetical protein